MKLLLITTSFPESIEDKSGSFIWGMTQALLKKGHKIDLIIPDRRYKIDWPLNNKNLSIIPINYFLPRKYQKLFYKNGVIQNIKKEPWIGIQSIPFIINCYLKIKKSIDNADAIISHWLFPSSFLVSLLKPGKKHLAISHGSDMRLLCSIPYGYRIVEYILKSNAKIICTSPALKQLIKKHEKKFNLLLNEKINNIPVYPMGVYLSYKDDETLRNKLLKMKQQFFLLGFLGRLISIKGVDILIKAVSQSKYKKNIMLLIAGDGPEKNRLEKLANSSGLNYKFLGELGFDSKTTFLKNIDSLAVPSRIEDSAPVTVIEALYAGCPVIASDITGIKNMSDDCAVYFKAESTLEEKISLLYNDKKLRQQIAIKSRQRGKLFYWDNYISVFEKFID